MYHDHRNDIHHGSGYSSHNNGMEFVRVLSSHDKTVPQCKGSLQGGDKHKDDGLVLFFFQAEDGIRDVAVTGVQTCALPISGFAFGLEVGDRIIGVNDFKAERKTWQTMKLFFERLSPFEYMALIISRGNQAAQDRKSVV